MSEDVRLVRYDAMVHAITECHRVDEVKDIRDKALALEIYARQANNRDAERKACEIRLRAERKAGQLLRDMAESGTRAGRANGVERGANKHLSDSATSVPTLAELGVSRGQSAKWQQLAAVPEPIFEAALQSDSKPSTAQIIKNAGAEPQPPVIRAMDGSAVMNDDSLWIWGRSRDFEQRGLENKDASDIYGGMTATMQADVRRILPRILDWLNQLSEAANGIERGNGKTNGAAERALHQAR